MKRIFLLIIIGILGVYTRVAAQDAATLFKRANNQYSLFDSERSREGNSSVMYTHLYECYKLYVKVLESPNNASQLNGTKNRLRSIYPYLMNGAAYFSEQKQTNKFLDLATAYIELPKMQAFRSENFQRSEQYAGLLYNTGVGYCKVGKYPLAIKYLKEFKNTGPTDEMLRNTYVKLGEAYQAQKDYIQLELVLEEASAKFPVSTNFLLWLYNVHVTTNNIQKLSNTIDRILSIDPNNIQVLPLKGRLLMKEGKFKESIDVLERLYKLQPDNLLVMQDLALANCNIGLEIMNVGRETTEETTRAMHFQRASEYLGIAQEFFLKLLKKEPASQKHMKMLSQVYAYRGLEAEHRVLEAMMAEGASFDNFQSRLVAYNEVHGQEGISIGQDVFVSAKTLVPPQLVIESVEFLDDNGNQEIDANERFSIRLTVKNQGKGDAYNLRLSLLEQQGYEYYFDGGREQDGGHLSAGASKTYSFDFIASHDMPSFLANIEIRVHEQNGFDTDHVLQVNTCELAIPRLYFADHLFKATEGSAITLNGNGTLTLAVQNRGLKTARNVNLNFMLPTDVFGTSELDIKIDSIPPGKHKEVDLNFKVNNRFEGDSLAIMVAATEELGSSLNEIFKVKLGEYIRSGGMTVLDGRGKNRLIIEDVVLSEDNELLNNIPVGGVNSNRYALIIGNEDYSIAGANAETNVPYANSDAYVFREYCIRTFGIPESQIEAVGDATAGYMKEKLDWLINVASANPNAEIFFYYSGHGSNDDATKEAYLIPTDISGNNVTMGIKLNELYERMGALSIKGAYIFLDACFSGGHKSAAPLTVQKGVKVKPNINGATGRTLSFSSSSGAETSSVYNEKKHGYYTYYLLKTLQDANGDLTLLEWFTQTEQKVRSATANGKPQHPEVNPSPGWNWENIKLKTRP